MKVGYKKLHVLAKEPQQMTDGAIGFDLFVSEIKEIDIGLGVVSYGTGIALDFPADYYCDLRARSSVAKTGWFLANGVGTVDNDYRGEIILKFYKNDLSLPVVDSIPYMVGDRCGQIVFFKRPKIELFVMEEISTTARATGGYGSTGR